MGNGKWEIAECVVLLAGVMLCAATPLGGDQRTTLRSRVDAVALYATVRGPDGRLVRGLQKDDFLILDDGQPAPIATFSRQPVPVTMTAMFDMSNSMAANFDRVRQAGERLIDALDDTDAVSIGTFGAEVAVSPLLTGDKPTLRRVLRTELWPGGGTPLWAGLRAAIDTLPKANIRRVVLVLTDGGDACPVNGYNGPPPDRFGSDRWSSGRLATELCSTSDQVEALALRGEVIVYSVFMQGNVAASGPDVAMLAWISEGTGGGHFTLEPRADLTRTFSDVLQELRSQYTLGFAPRFADGKIHKLQVSIKGRGFLVKSRRAYVAPTSDR